MLQEVDAAHLEPLDDGGYLRFEDSLVDPGREVEGFVDVHPVEVAFENYPEVVPSDHDHRGPKIRKSSLEMAVSVEIAVNNHCMATPPDGLALTSRGDSGSDDWNLVDLDLVDLVLDLDTNLVLVAVRGLHTAVCLVGNLAHLEELVDHPYPLVACLDIKHAPEQRLVPGMKQV